MEDEVIEVIGVEHLKNILSSLNPEDIVRPAYENWYACQKTGHTILNLENGEILGLGIELNQLPIASMIYIELFTIKSSQEPIDVQEFFSASEYEEFLEFSKDEPCDYIPDIVSDFCHFKGINEDERKIGLLAYNFEKNEQSNYSMWESKIINKYYEATDENHNPFKFQNTTL